MKKMILLALALLLSFVFSSFAVSATHSSSVVLAPEWSPANADVDYQVTFCKDSGDPVNEVRIYKNYDGSVLYSGFSCEPKDGWELLYIGTYPACFYVAKNSSVYLDDDGDCETFEFSAHSPGPDNCDLTWRFETRDTQDFWTYLYDTTSVDDSAPTLTKLVGTPQDGVCPPDAGETCWVTQNTPITVQVSDSSGDCGVSGLKYCKISYVLDDDQEYVVKEKYFDNDVVDWSYTFNFPEDSEHLLKVTCEDVAGNVLDDEELFKVDTTAPTTDIDLGGAYFSDGTSQWLDTASWYSFTAVDGGDICAIGDVNTYYQDHYFPDEADWDYCFDSCDSFQTSSYDDDGWILYDGSDIPSGDESCHVVEYFSEDKFGNKEPVKKECFFVDKTPPKTSYDLIGPNVDCAADDPSGCVSWITNETNIVLSCADQGPHPSNHVSLWYRTWDDISEQWSDWVDPNGNHVEKIISFDEDSVHKVQYYCEDAVGKSDGTRDDPHELVFRVDSTAPEIVKEVVGPQLGQCPPAPGSDDDCIITDESDILVSVSDPDPTGNGCNVDRVSCEWDYYWNGQWFDGGSFAEPGTRISFGEDSNHTLRLVCSDALGNEVVDEELFRVDITPPETRIDFGSPFMRDYYPKGCDDDYDHPVQPLALTTPDCGNLDPDSASPDCYKIPDCSLASFINSSTPVSLSAFDEKAGVNETLWRNLVITDEAGWKACANPDYYCNPGFYSNYVNESIDWNSYDGAFYKDEESCHVIEYYSVDNIGNEEYLRSACVFVDNTPPEVNKTVGNPQYVDDQDNLFITQDTELTFVCDDRGLDLSADHPADHVTLHWRYRFSDACGNWTDDDWSDWNSISGSDLRLDDPYRLVYTLTFDEDSCHEIEYYCEDGLGNKGEVFSEVDIVDSQHPNSDLTISDPVWVVDGVTYVDNATRFFLNAFDPEPHPSGVKDIYYNVELVDDSLCYDPETYCEPVYSPEDDVWIPYSGDFNIPEESCHKIEFYSLDNVLNKEPVKAVCVFADHSAPVIDLSYGDPQYQGELGFYINNYTNISVDVFDPEPHPSGVSNTEYRVSLVDDSLCYDYEVCQGFDASGLDSDWIRLDNPLHGVFNIPEESCHLIEVRSTDNVNKSSYVRNCVFVDTSEPDTNKTVGIPKEPMSEEHKSLGAVYYPELLGDEVTPSVCDEEGVCWDVTLLTPITLACNDPEPHPSGATDVCFKVDFDGSDVTEEYCGDNPLTDEGYCCLSSDEPVEFYFQKESWHKLSYYCIDNVDNEGLDNIDTEYFKVEGTAFKIQLNKKWNLISVPVKLIDNSLDQVFAGHEDTVVSVWTYDNGTWHVYTPDGNPANDDLTTMLPGWGYWVLTTDDDMLTIGGSLLSPVVAPPSKKITPGWNLIGYYGAEGAPEQDGVPGYFGPAGNGKPVKCALHSLTPSVWDYGVSSIWSYWEPFNPNVWLDLGYFDRMDPGAGYWVFAYEDGEYAPSTTCSFI